MMLEKNTTLHMGHDSKLSRTRFKEGAGTSMETRKEELLTTICSNNYNHTNSRAFETLNNGSGGVFQNDSTMRLGSQIGPDFTAIDLELNKHGIEQKLLQEKLRIRESDLHLLKQTGKLSISRCSGFNTNVSARIAI